MTDRTATSMDSLEITEFLEEQKIGVLSMAKSNDGYAIPVSFAYDDTGPDVYLRLGYAPDSKKRTFLEATGQASFVVYDDAGDGWRSVVAEGRIEELSDNELDTSILQAVKGLDIPFFSVHSTPPSELEFTIARLDVSRLTGLAEARDSR